MFLITPVTYFINRILLILHLPIINQLKIHQKYIYHKIRKTVPTSINHLKYIKEWSSEDSLNENSPIFLMWWTGIDTMPPIVKLCYINLCNNAKKHPIILITQQNYQYILPTSISEEASEVVELYYNNKIRIQHLSDMIRTLILSKVGGIWIDATVFVTSDWDKELIGRPFYSGRRTQAYANSGKSITQGQWTSYFIASTKANPLITFIYNGLKECYLHNGEIKEYYTMDYLFAIALKKSSVIKKQISTIPQINANLFALETLMHKSYDEKEYNAFFKKAPFFKLNHRTTYSILNKEGHLSVFGYMMQTINPLTK